MIPQIILGTFQNKRYEDLLGVVDAAISNGCMAFDTAPSYGTEIDLGRALHTCMEKYGMKRNELYVSDKVDAWQMIKHKGDVRPFVLDAVRKMDMEYMDIVWIHWPIEEYLDNTWKSLTVLKEEGLVKEIGICNVRVRHLQRLNEKGCLPKFIQIERHPLRTCNAEMEYCNDNNIMVFDYSPICRMHPDLRNSDVLKSISEKYGKNIGQVILRWHVDTGAVPIFMSKKPSRVKENLDIFDFSLTEKEMEIITSLNKNYKIFLESWGCPGF